MGLDGKRVVKVCEVWFIGWVKFLLALGLESLTLDSINLANLMFMFLTKSIVHHCR